MAGVRHMRNPGGTGVTGVITVHADLKCTLCGAETTLFCTARDRHYYRCFGCHSVLLDPDMYLSEEEERQRYEQHNNDVQDPRYQKFVAPIVQQVEKLFDQSHVGLDFGAGTGPVIAKLLRDKGFQLELYDRFFCDNRDALSRRYDYIVCCEVIEHFHFPGRMFELLRSLLSPNGSLLCMTEIYREEIDFAGWYYKNDPTHVFFYHEHALNWIKDRYGFSGVTGTGRLVHFQSRGGMHSEDYGV